MPTLLERRPFAPHTTKRGNAMTGCLIALVVVLVIAIIGGIIVAVNFRSWISSGVRHMAVTLIEETDLPDEERRGMIAHVDRLAEDFKEKRITLEDLGRVVEEITDSPLIPLGAVKLVEIHYINPSGLGEEEKAEARLSLNRFAQGVHAKTIPESAIDEVVAPIGTRGPDGEINLREPNHVSDDELRQAVETARRHADDAGVPEEYMEISLADELGRTIDRALGRTPPE